MWWRATPRSGQSNAPFDASSASGTCEPISTCVHPTPPLTARAIDAEVRRIIRESYETARRLLDEHRCELDALADALLARETLDEREVLEVTLGIR